MTDLKPCPTCGRSDLSGYGPFTEITVGDKTVTTHRLHDYDTPSRAEPNVKPLAFGEPNRNGSLYCEVPIGASFSAYYEIEFHTATNPPSATVSFGVHCHEFGAEDVWKGPADEAVDAANRHNARRV